jgi:hypothetical protein
MAPENGHACNGTGKSNKMEAIFPEALLSLREVDPEVADIVEDEKRRQW